MNVWDAMMNAARPRGAGQTHATVAGALGWLATMPHGVATVVVGVAAQMRNVVTMADKIAAGQRPERLQVMPVAEWARPGIGFRGPVLFDATAIEELGRRCAKEKESQLHAMQVQVDQHRDWLAQAQAAEGMRAG